MTKRRRPAPDDAVKGPAVAADSAPRQGWPPAPQAEQAEVALFTVRGPAAPGASVIDVNIANRLRLGDAQSLSAGTTTDAATLQDLVARQVSAVLEQSGLAEFVAHDAADGEAGDNGADHLIVNTEPAFPADETVPSLPLTANVDDDPFAERPLDAFPSESAVGRGHAIERALDAVPSLDVFPLELRDDVPSESPAPALPLPGNSEGRLTSSMAALAALAARTGTAARRSGRGWLVAASIVLAVGVAGLVLSRLSDGPTATDDAALSVRTLDILASLAPGIGNRTAAVEPAPPSDLDGPVALITPQSSTPVVTATSGQASRLEPPATAQRSAPPPSAPALSPRAAPAASAPTALARAGAAGTTGASRGAAGTTGASRDSAAGAAGVSRESAVGPPGPPRDRAVVAAAAPPSAAGLDAPANTGTTPPVTAPPATTMAAVVRTEVSSAPATETPLPSPVAPSSPGPAAASGPRADSTRADAPTADRAAPATDTAASDGIADALQHLQRAYEQRDATLVKAVWPTVNERALARAFDGLRSQSVTFDRCQLNVSGAAGEVECRGVTTYVPRVGGQYQRTESRQWKFRVQKGGESWVITSAAAR